MPIIVNLDVMMAKRKMTLSKLSKKVDLSYSNLSALKRGKVKAIRFSTLDSICKALDCKPEDILGYRPDNYDIQIQSLVKKAYSAFNSRDIDTALSTFHSDVQWPKAFEGGYATGHDEVRKYWTRQWSGINPNVEPIGFYERQNGTVEVTVKQIVKDLQGKLLFDGVVKHIYTIQDNLLRRMDIELV
jgi:DNA-binding Xre family transcriptional regulator